MVITAAFWYAVGFDAIVKQYWWVTVYYIGLRWIFNLLMGRAKLLNWRKQIVVAGLATLLSFGVAEKLLVDREAVLPSARGLTDELWIAVIAFVYLTFTRVTWPQLGPSATERKHKFILAQYHTFRKRYGKVIEHFSVSTMAEALSYAVLIYESFNRPRIYQWIENTILYPAGIANTLGPMQVSTQVNLPARELVRVGVERVSKVLIEAERQVRREYAHYLDVSEQEQRPGESESTPQPERGSSGGNRPLSEFLQQELVSRAAALYNIRSDYPTEVAGIFTLVRDAFYPVLNPIARQAEETKLG